MKGIKIENGDVVRFRGKPVILENAEYYSQRIKHAIRLSLGESVYEPLVGLDWFTVFSTKIPRERVLVEIRKILIKDPETVSVNNIEIVESNDSERRIHIQFSANTIFGTVTEEV
ncbi:DUF2634 domain-containing protein [Leptospira kmetyi]|uniref:DUF2634 domain-containing protein n=1 Tax=Leptospira kmetyi TaxID=408139 RepID=A0A5F1XZC2_9LEPT|nr:DUF2634 domain-containing protein [Leptospira kmetyi]AYV56956.1 DUF2634 domain-containing protein [Leptospira kmetyi]EQA53104.1 PF10934 family protein [Leptospira kmetyi serovar Malaysia str. Bejo-Iso9]TGK21681.1 DUF2634 domain-containing protein [Leptospira kmetyi]TGK28608.1 DUF2634 domain-containing protein [Leptospira kmetyi]TGL68024.1 DUF2634 domain-containing protein [Leptospira kmetyi]